MSAFSSLRYNFFLANAGYSYDPKTETPMQGRARCAARLAAAEVRAQKLDVAFHWALDGMTSAEWTSQRPVWNTWECVGRTRTGGVFASLCGIDFGRDGEPWSSSYRRVVEAELACELPEAS